MTAKGAATLGAFLGAALAAGVTVLLHSAQGAPMDDVRKDVAEMKADIKMIKCKLNIEGTCPPSR